MLALGPLALALSACTCGGEGLVCDVDTDCGPGLACLARVCAEPLQKPGCGLLRQSCNGECCAFGENCRGGVCVSGVSGCLWKPDPLFFETPRRAWWWPYSDATGATVRAMDMPDFIEVMSTPAVVPLGHDPEDPLAPAVVFNSFKGGGGRQEEGVLRAVDGRDGKSLWTVTDPALRTNGLSSMAAGDIDGDGRIELVTGAFDPTPARAGGVIAFGSRGQLLWRNRSVQIWWGGASIADLDGVAPAEVIVGSTVLDGMTGAIKCAGVGASADNGVGPLSAVADLDLDGLPEIVAGAQVFRYRADGAGGGSCLPMWPPSSLPDGFVAVADFDPASGDRHPEVVVVGRGTVRIHDWDGSLRAGPVEIPGGGRGGPPTVGDFDGGGDREISVAGLASLTVYKSDLSILWSRATQDFSSSMTGASVFDFEGDGSAEVVYNDECFTRIYEGSDGAVLLEQPNTTCTTYEYPLVADVDADGRAEILTVANDVCSNRCPFAGQMRGIQLLESPSDNWVNTRRIWNQHAYSVTNIEDDGSVPSRAEPFWIEPGPNSFRQNVQGRGTFDAPDFVAGNAGQKAGGCPGSLELYADVTNRGAVAISAPVPVAFYQGDPASGGALIGVGFTSGRMAPGESRRATFTWRNPPLAPVPIVIHLDEEGPGTFRYRECVETNNAAAFDGGCPGVEGF